MTKYKNKYKLGYRVERELVIESRAKGLVAFGSRGSHSPFDVCVISKLGTVHLYQLKSTIQEKVTESFYKEDIAKLKKILVNGVKHYWIRYRGRKKSIPKWIFKWDD